MSESGLNGSGGHDEKKLLPMADPDEVEEKSIRSHLLTVHRDAVNALAGVREAKESLASAVVEMHGVVEFARQELRDATIRIERLAERIERASRTRSPKRKKGAA